MPELVNLDNIPLVVARIETDNRYGVGYVMEPVPDLHLQHNAFIDSTGRTHHAMVEGKSVFLPDRNGKTLREYTLWFEKEHDPGFSIGEEITRPPAPWRRAIPKANLIGLDYRASIVPFNAKSMESDVLHECRFVIDCDGDVTVSIARSIHRTPGVVENVNVGKETAKKLLRRFQRCLSECDCYSTILFDDTYRTMDLRFSDRSESSLDGVFAYGEFGDENHDDTAWVISDFVSNYLRLSNEHVFF